MIDDDRAREHPVNLLRNGAAEVCMPDELSGQFTELLQQWTQGDEKALRALLPLVYKELRRLAHYHLQFERPDHTLQSTALGSRGLLPSAGRAAS